MRQAQSRQRQAISKVNSAINKYNREVKSLVNNYNREVRAHNSRVRSQQTRISSEISKLNRISSSTRYSNYQNSVNTLHNAYTVLDRENTYVPENYEQNRLLDLSENENANSLEVANVILDGQPQGAEQHISLIDTKIINELSSISSDLDNRWKGALFSLNASNPDAARHFCISAREIVVQILEEKAPDKEVFAWNPECEIHQESGKPSRRTKIKYFLNKKNIDENSLEDFIEKDVENILSLFSIFNTGTHGESGKFSLDQLFSVKKRVEDGIIFLSTLVS
jgi:hypothetical protein